MHAVTDERLGPYVDFFDQFVDRYRNGDSHDQALIQLKYDHTGRVVKNASIIAAKVFEDDPEIQLCAVLAALFHDIARFPQYQLYKTFNDRLSVDHGRLGVTTLKAENVLEGLPKDIRKFILACVSLHNKKSLPRAIPRVLKRVCDVVRDSDKLDIFTVMLDHFTSGVHDKTITLELTEHPINYTVSFYEKVLNNQDCAYTEMQWTNDFKLMLAHWVYQLNFPISYELFDHQNSFQRLFALLPDDDRIQHLKLTLSQVIARRTSAFAVSAV